MGGGFTLAEVLITLAVIGIVAGITIPSIVAQNQKTELEAEFAKTYRTLMYAVNMAVAENGSFEAWEWKETYSGEEMDNFVRTYFLPYLNVAKFCPSDGSVTGCFPDVMYKRLNGSNWDNLNKRTFPRVLLADGTAICFFLESNYTARKTRSMSFDVDINGRRKPNILGRDSYAFNFYPQTGEFLPNGINKDFKYDEKTKSFPKNNDMEIRNNCMNTASNGALCAARVVLEGFKINY